MQRVARAEGTGREPALALVPAVAGDEADVRGLLESAGLPDAGLAEQFPAAFVVARDAGGELAGVAAVELHGASGLLRSVAVAARLRGAGLGAALVRERVEWGRARGLRELYLLTTGAAPWFARLGFRRVERASAPAAVRASVEFASACPASAVAMRLALCDGDEVRARYAALASSGHPRASAVTAGLYARSELDALGAPILSLGCGNPSALAELRPGEVVLDLGSGGGLDVLLSARRVAPHGRAIGVDATEEMLALARANQARAGVANAEFLLGAIEDLPLADRSVDVVLSNCVLNLSADRPRALAEAFRVLRPGGRLALSDIVALRPPPPARRREAESWLGCSAGTLEPAEYAALLAGAGFEGASVTPTRTYGAEHARALLAERRRPEPAWLDEIDGAFASAFVRARKPLQAPPRNAAARPGTGCRP